MESKEVVVVGGGISGLAFAEQAANAGRSALVLEAGSRLGGCLHSIRLESGYWLEMGAHTAYNSYGGFIDIAETLRSDGEFLAREKRPFRLWRGGRLEKIGAALGKLRMAAGLLGLPFRTKAGRTVAAYYGGLVGRSNYERVVSRLLAAVSSQRPDRFPADMLFKKRPRRKELPRSFTFEGGIQRVAEWIAEHPRVEAQTEARVTRVEAWDRGFRVHFGNAESVESPRLALAVPPNVAAHLLRDSFPAVAQQLDKIEVTKVVSTAVVVPASKVANLEPVAGIVPAEDDLFWSAVSRDVVPDAERRAFTFHFRADSEASQRRARILQVLGIEEQDVLEEFEARSVLPSPVLGHHDIVETIDQALAGTNLALSGNYFAGLAIEDCVARSRAEYRRVA